MKFDFNFHTSQFLEQMSPRWSPTRTGCSNNEHKKDAKVTPCEISNDPPYPSKENPKNNANAQKKGRFLRKRKIQNYEQQNDYYDNENSK